jgi:hypothetical protein
MSETRLVCSVCDGVFSEHQVQLKAVNPEEDQLQCPTAAPPAWNPTPSNPFEQEEGEM